MLRGLSGVLEKSKNLNLPALNGNKPNQEKKVSAPKAAVAPTPAQKPVFSQVVSGRVQISIAPEDKAKTDAAKYRDALADEAIAEFTKDSISQGNADLVIAAAYKQVFGNAHLMESERSREAESQMRSGEISVLEFVRKLAKSDHYRKLFWEKFPNVTAIELNFKHLLGRAPESYSEISQHIQIIADGGFEAEIDAYLDSDEYFQNFGDMLVPYARGYQTQTGRNAAAGYTRSFPLFGAACGSDKSAFGGDTPKVKASLLDNGPGSIPSIRSIPDSYPEDIVIVPPPRIPLELKLMARQLIADMEYKRGFRPKY